MKTQEQIEARVNMLKTSMKNGAKDLDASIAFLGISVGFKQEEVHTMLREAVDQKKYSLANLCIWILE